MGYIDGQIKFYFPRPRRERIEGCFLPVDIQPQLPPKPLYPTYKQLPPGKNHSRPFHPPGIFPLQLLPIYYPDSTSAIEQLPFFQDKGIMP